MSKKPEFVQIEAGEDINSVRDRLSFTRGQRVLLIWPEEGTALTRKLDLVLIQREAMRRAIRLALVTHDPVVEEHAKELNISTFETIGASERGRWKRGRSKVFLSRYHKPKDEPEPEQLMGVASRVRVPRKAVSRLWSGVGRLGILLLLGGVLLAVAYVVVPSASVTISLAKDTVQVETEIIADPNVTDLDVENAIIPATRLLVEIEQVATIPTSGTENLPDAVATGSVVFVNQTSREIEIPVGTVVSTSAGTPIEYQTTEEGTLPAGDGQQLELPIEALSSASGELGNVESGLINTVIGPLENSVTVFNLSPTFGGESRMLPVVTIEDQASLLGSVRGLIQAQAYTAMLPKLTESQQIIESTIHITEERSDWKEYSAQPGDIAEELTLSMRAVVEAVAVDQRLAQQIAFAQMARSIDRGRVIQPETLAYMCCPVIEIESGERVKFRIVGGGTVSGQINIGELQERLVGRSIEDAMRYMITELDLSPGTLPQVVISPEWLEQMPLLPMRIQIRLIDIQ